MGTIVDVVEGAFGVLALVIGEGLTLELRSRHATDRDQTKPPIITRAIKKLPHIDRDAETFPIGTLLTEALPTGILSFFAVA
jgi:hypothetical protein